MPSVKSYFPGCISGPLPIRRAAGARPRPVETTGSPRVLTWSVIQGPSSVCSWVIRGYTESALTIVSSGQLGQLLSSFVHHKIVVCQLYPVQQPGTVERTSLAGYHSSHLPIKTFIYITPCPTHVSFFRSWVTAYCPRRRGLELESITAAYKIFSTTPTYFYMVWTVLQGVVIKLNGYHWHLRFNWYHGESCTEAECVIRMAEEIPPWSRNKKIVVYYSNPSLIISLSIIIGNLFSILQRFIPKQNTK